MLLHIPLHVRETPLYFFHEIKWHERSFVFPDNNSWHVSISKINSVEEVFWTCYGMPYVHRWFYIHALLWQGMTERSDRLPIPQSFILWRICRVCCILNRKTDVSLGGFFGHAMACPYEPRLWLFMPCYGKAWLTGPGSFMIPWSLAWWILILPPGKKEKVIIPSFWSHWSMIKSKIENLPWR